MCRLTPLEKILVVSPRFRNAGDFFMVVWCRICPMIILRSGHCGGSNFQNTQELIFVVDSNDQDRVVEARDEQHRMLNEEQFLSASVIDLVSMNESCNGNIDTVANVDRSPKLCKSVKAGESTTGGHQGLEGKRIFQYDNCCSRLGCLDHCGRTLATFILFSSICDLSPVSPASSHMSAQSADKKNGHQLANIGTLAT